MLWGRKGWTDYNSITAYMYFRLSLYWFCHSSVLVWPTRKRISDMCVSRDKDKISQSFAQFRNFKLHYLFDFFIPVTYKSWWEDIKSTRFWSASCLLGPWICPPPPPPPHQFIILKKEREGYLKWSQLLFFFFFFWGGGVFFNLAERSLSENIADSFTSNRNLTILKNSWGSLRSIVDWIWGHDISMTFFIRIIRVIKLTHCDWRLRLDCNNKLHNTRTPRFYAKKNSRKLCDTLKLWLKFCNCPPI